MWGVTLEGPGRSPWWDIVGTFFALEFASAGLFITTHGESAVTALRCSCWCIAGCAFKSACVCTKLQREATECASAGLFITTHGERGGSCNTL